MYRPETDEFAFTRSTESSEIRLRGTSLRYAAIVALGAYWLDSDQQRPILGGRTVDDFVALLIGRLPQVDNLGDAALVCWAAAQAGHPLLSRALERLRELDHELDHELDGADRTDRPRYTVEAAWVVSALAAARARPDVDVEAHLARARHRLLASRHPGSPLFPHATASGLLPWYRSHIACYADQVYPIQALARLHRSGDDPDALRAAIACADRICALQGSGGQWWWHYDARTGDVVEGYPVYTVHQHAMGPMALLDLAEAAGPDGPDYREPIERGLRWITDPPELRDRGGVAVPMIRDDDGVTERKVYRGDPRKAVRAVNGLTTRLVRGLRLPGVHRVFRPSTVDTECRPYEFGWLLFTWLSRNTAPDPGAAGSPPKVG